MVGGDSSGDGGQGLSTELGQGKEHRKSCSRRLRRGPGGLLQKAPEITGSGLGPSSEVAAGLGGPEGGGGRRGGHLPVGGVGVLVKVTTEQ
ncbi:unnamed protein product [Gadus morhua 'NCC']